MTKLTIEKMQMSEKDKSDFWGRDDQIPAVKVFKREARPLYLATIPINEALATARKLGANPLMLYQLINTAHKMASGCKWVKVPGKMLIKAGLPRQREYEAANALEAAGLIVRRNKPGCKNRYRLT